MLKLNLQDLQLIKAHAERTYPQECCGLILGQIELNAESIKVGAELWATENTWTSELAQSTGITDSGLDQTRRYWIDPQDLLTAQKYARDRNLAIIGIYHSHPDAAAVPSECDRQLAWPQYSYLIVSVQQGVAQEIQSWMLDEDQQFQLEALLVEPQTPSDPVHSHLPCQ